MPTALEDFATGIGFRFVQPDMPVTTDDIRGLVKEDDDVRAFDIANTIVPGDEGAVVRELGPLCAVPRMSTFAISAVLNRAVREMPAGTMFLNVGTWCGFTLFSGMRGNPDKVCIGVDNFSEFTAPERTTASGPAENVPRELFTRLFAGLRTPAHQFHQMDYREYFARVHRGPIGVYLYDGGHSYEDQLHGLRIAEPFFSENCIVFVDDTNQLEPRRGTFDFVACHASHRYRLLFDYRTAGNGHPTWWNGLMAFQRVA